jgi:hypothetical protein
VTLAEVKALNNISVTTYDTFISANISTVCRAIEQFCRRRFVKADWIQWAPRAEALLTDNWPINYVAMLGVAYDVILITDTSNIFNFNVTQTTSNNIEVESKLSVINTSTMVATDFLFSTYPTLGQLKTAVETAIPTVTFAYQAVPSTITIANVSCLTLRATVGKTLSAGIDYFNQSTSNGLGNIYRISDTSDRLFINPNTAMVSGVSRYATNSQYLMGFNNIDNISTLDWYQDYDLMIAYNAGYTTSNMPKELKWIVSSIFADLMALFDVQGSGAYKGLVKSEGLGDYNYTLGGNDQNKWGVGDTAGLAGILNKYHDALSQFMKKVI